MENIFAYIVESLVAIVVAVGTLVGGVAPQPTVPLAHDQQPDQQVQVADQGTDTMAAEQPSPSTPTVVGYTGSYGNASITTDSSYRYIRSNGLPDHQTGTFPNAGNPNAIAEQDHDFRVTISPRYQSVATPVPIPGVALNGIPLEPATAERYAGDPSWHIEAFDADGIGGLGIDWSNAHVQPNGNYHYHAVPEGLLAAALADQSGDLIQLAWAADGFPIYYSQSNAYQSSWQLKSGTRPSGPGGVYDGTYTQDFEYVAGSGNLDECNGLTIDGQYVYMFSDSFPYIQRCVHGSPDSSFDKGGGGAGPGGPGRTGDGAGPAGSQQGAGRTPPAEAIAACSGQSAGASCSFAAPQGTISGQCRDVPGGQRACVPR